MIIVFDFETNGLDSEKYSPLEIAAFKLDTSLNTIDKFHRFYYPKDDEGINKEAQKIHKLDYDKITILRKDASYARNFKDDHDFLDFARGTRLYVAHNIKFDEKFLPFKLCEGSTFCTMLNNVGIVTRGNRWPKLVHCLDFYKIKYDKNNLHSAYHDVYYTVEVLRSMNKENSKLQDILKRFQCPS